MFFVFFYIGIIGFFLDMVYYYGLVLIVFGSIVVVLFVIWGLFYVFENYGLKNNIVYLFLYGVMGLLIFVLLLVVLILFEGGFIL